jgi:epoxyqueuosine reductase
VDRLACQRFAAANRDRGMPYLTQTLEARQRGASSLLPGARSLLVVARSYHQPALDGQRLAVARYALGKDYHLVLRRDLARLMFKVRGGAPGLDYRLCVATSPLLERAYAQRAGLGWIGHSGMLLSRGLGSYTLLGSVVMDQDLAPTSTAAPAVDDGCGHCRSCIEACPTAAIVAPRVLDPQRCLSYWTVEHRGPFDATTPALGGRVFGCDRCQEVCPINRGARPGRDGRLAARPQLRALDAAAVRELDDADLRSCIAGSALTRAGLVGLRRNARAACTGDDGKKGQAGASDDGEKD